MINQPPVLKSIFIQKFQLVSFWFPFAIFKLKPREHQNPSLLIIENLKKQLFPNDRFLIKFFIKIISLDSSQRVPPMSPCPPLIIMFLMCFLWICPFIPNVPHSFQPIVFKPYPKFYGSGAVYLGGIQERPYKVYTYLVGGAVD